MDIPVNAKVECVDGHCGHVSNLIVNPTTEQVTHLVVTSSLFADSARLVPIETVVECQLERVCLNLTKAEVQNEEPFYEASFLGLDPAEMQSDSYLLWPLDEMESGIIVVEHKRVPQGELELHRGARVVATDGEVGRVDAFLLAPRDGKITHVVLREGHLWGRRDVTIPVAEIERIEENAVYLKLDKRAIEALPAVAVRTRRQGVSKSGA